MRFELGFGSDEMGMCAVAKLRRLELLQQLQSGLFSCEMILSIAYIPR